MPTRLYFPASTAADISTPSFASWSYTSEALRRKMVVAKGSSAIAEGTQIGPWDENVGVALDRQYISEPLEGAQSISGTAKMQLMARQVGNLDVDSILTRLYVVSNDGNTTRGELLGIGSYGTTGQLINNATHRNVKAILPGTAMSTVSASDGDRLVLEVGYNNDWAFTDNPVAAAKYGENASDLPEDDSQTSDGAGWLELSGTLTFEGGGPPPAEEHATFAIRRRSGGVNTDHVVTLGATDAYVRAPIWVPVDRAELQAVQMGMTRGPETPATNVQLEDMWLMVEYLPISAPGGVKVDLKKFRRRFGAGR